MTDKFYVDSASYNHFVNNTISDNASYGINITGVTCEYLTCEKCGVVLQENWQFCPFCGEKLNV